MSTFVESAINLYDRLTDLIARQTEWADRTFGPPEISGPIPPIKHIGKEVVELIEAIREYDKNSDVPESHRTIELKENVYTEFADIFLLLLDSSRRFGIKFTQLIDIARKKHEECRERIWDVPEWTYTYDEVNEDTVECKATNGKETILGYAETYLKAKIAAQKAIRLVDREPHEHKR